jgi:hypothetical protein
VDDGVADHGGMVPAHHGARQGPDGPVPGWFDQ